MQPQRLKLVQEAFKHLDTNKNGVLELGEIKAKFNGSRHPDVLSRIKNSDEAQFEFSNLFNSLHSANHGFKDERVVTVDEFIEYHAIVNTQIERDCEFRNFMIGVWNLDVLENMDPEVRTTQYVDPEIAGKKAVAFPAKNSHEQWKHDFHRSMFGDQTIIAHPQPSQDAKEAPLVDRTAGVRQSDFS